MYASFNRFDHNVYRDATIVTSIDTMTSMLAGFTIFGILGHLAQESGTTEIGEVVKGGAGLAFISYPDAIGRFKFVPQVRDVKRSNQVKQRKPLTTHDFIDFPFVFIFSSSFCCLGFLCALFLHAVRVGHWQ